MSERAVQHVHEHSRTDGDVRRLLDVLAVYADENGHVTVIDDVTGGETRYILTPGGRSLTPRADA